MIKESYDIDFFTRKFVWIALQFEIIFFRLIALVWARLRRVRKKEKLTVHRIAAVWYWPEDFPSASFTRMGIWKKYFEKEGVEFDHYHVGSMTEYTREYEGKNRTRLYWFYCKFVYRRFKQFLQLHDYDVVWIDRWFLVHYPSPNGFWEELLGKMNQRIVMDSTDGTDYTGYPALITSIYSKMDRLVVAYEGLYDFYGPKYPGKVFRFNYTISEEGYRCRDHWQVDNLPVIGWMGSPSNFLYLQAIEGELQKVFQVQPFRMIIICRQRVELNIPGCTISYHRYGADYFELIKRFDIGVAPFTEKNFGTTGKIGMKHQEFLLCQVPQVCSPQGISEWAVDHTHCLIANEVEDWAPALLEMLDDAVLRERLAKAGRQLCLEHYTADGQWPLVKQALTSF